MKCQIETFDVPDERYPAWVAKTVTICRTHGVQDWAGEIRCCPVGKMEEEVGSALQKVEAGLSSRRYRDPDHRR